MTLTWSWARLPTAKAFDPPKPCICGGPEAQLQVHPYNNVLACLADLGTGQITGSNVNDISATFDWSFNWSCPQAQVNACQVCVEGDFQEWWVPIGQWVEISGGSTGQHPMPGSCGKGYTTTGTCKLTYNGAVEPGRRCRFVLYVAPWDPTISEDCAGQ